MKKGKKLLVTFLSLCVMAFTGCVPKTEKYTVVIDGVSTEVESGSLATMPDVTPTKEADAQYTYTFDGWYVADAEGNATTTKWDFSTNTVTGDVKLVAVFTPTVREYSVTFKNEDGSVISTSNVAYGSAITLPTAPTKAGTAEYTYTFAGWTGYTDGMTVDGNEEFTASFTATKNKYTVTFKNEDGSTISSSEVDYGTAITLPTAPSKAATAEYTYAFAGWTGYTDGMTVTGNVEFTASFTATKNKYTVTFKNEDGSVISSEEVDYGSVITLPTAPTKDATAEYTYTFAGWTGYTDGMTVDGAEEFTASFSATKNKYTVTFKNEDGTTFSTSEVDYGSEIVLPQTNPTKDATAEYTYTFAGWTGYTAGMTVDGAEEFTASFSATKNKYTVTFKNEDGSTFSTSEVDYGAAIVLPQTNPTKDATAEYTYAFAGWTGYTDGMTVDGAEEFTASFTATKNKYNVVFKNEDGSVFETFENVEYGTEITLPETNPTKDATAEYTYAFAGWTGYTDGMTVDGAEEFTASFTATKNTYAITARESDKYTVEFYKDGQLVEDLSAVEYGDLTVRFTIAPAYNKNIITMFAGENEIRAFVPGPEANQFDANVILDGAYEFYIDDSAWVENTYALTAIESENWTYTINFTTIDPDWEPVYDEDGVTIINDSDKYLYLDDTSALAHGDEVVIIITHSPAYDIPSFIATANGNSLHGFNLIQYYGEPAYMKTVIMDGDYEIGVDQSNWVEKKFALSAVESDKYTIEFLVENPDFDWDAEEPDWDNLYVVLEDTSSIKYGTLVTVRITVAEEYNQTFVDNTIVYMNDRHPMFMNPGDGVGVYEFSVQLDNNYEIRVDDSEWALNTYALTSAVSDKYTVEFFDMEGNAVEETSAIEYGTELSVKITVADAYSQNYVDNTNIYIGERAPRVVMPAGPNAYQFGIMVDGDYEIGVNDEAWALNTYALSAVESQDWTYTINFTTIDPDWEPVYDEDGVTIINDSDKYLYIDDTTALEHGAEVVIIINTSPAYDIPSFIGTANGNPLHGFNLIQYYGEPAYMKTVTIDGDYEIGVDQSNWVEKKFELSAVESEKYTIEFLVENPDFDWDAEEPDWDNLYVVLEDASNLKYGTYVTVRITVAEEYNQTFVDNTIVYMNDRHPMFMNPGNGVGVYEFSIQVDNNYNVRVDDSEWSLNTYALTAVESDKYTIEFTAWDEEAGEYVVLDDTSAIEHGAEIQVVFTLADGYTQTAMPMAYAGEIWLRGLMPAGEIGKYSAGVTVDGDYEFSMDDAEWSLNTYALITSNGTGYTVAVSGSDVYGETQIITVTVARNYTDDLTGIIVTVAGTQYTDLDWAYGENDAMVATIELVNGVDLVVNDNEVTVAGLVANEGIIPVNYMIESLAGGTYSFHSQDDAEGVDNGEGIEIDINAFIGENAKAIEGFTYERYEYEVGGAEANVYYTRNSYAVKFYDAEGTEIAGYGDMKYGARIDAPADPEKADDGETYYTFAGWALEEDGEAVDVLSTVPVDGIAYYPVYTANEYTYSVVLPTEQVGYTITAEGAGIQTDEITFTFTLTEEDWNVDGLVINVAGQDKTADIIGGVLTITPADLGLTKGGEIVVTVEGLAYNTYAIDGLSGEGYIINVNEDASQWIKGATVTFTLDLRYGYDKSTPVVMIGGDEIVAEEGVYSFVVEGDTTIVVEGIEANTYNVVIAENEAYTASILTLEGEVATEIKHGEQYTIYLEVDANYNRSDVTAHAYVDGMPGSMDTPLGLPAYDEEKGVYYFAVTRDLPADMEIEFTGFVYNNYAVSANVSVVDMGRISDVTEISVKVNDGEAVALTSSEMVLDSLTPGEYTLTFIDNDTTGREYFSDVLRTVSFEIVEGGEDVVLDDLYLGHNLLSHPTYSKYIQYTADGVVDVYGDEGGTTGTFSGSGGAIADNLVGDWEISYSAKYDASNSTEPDPGYQITFNYGEDKFIVIYLMNGNYRLSTKEFTLNLGARKNGIKSELTGADSTLDVVIKKSGNVLYFVVEGRVELGIDATRGMFSCDNDNYVAGLTAGTGYGQWGAGGKFATEAEAMNAIKGKFAELFALDDQDVGISLGVSRNGGMSYVLSNVYTSIEYTDSRHGYECDIVEDYGSITLEDNYDADLENGLISEGATYGLSIAGFSTTDEMAPYTYDMSSYNLGSLINAPVTLTFGAYSPAEQEIVKLAVYKKIKGEAEWGEEEILYLRGEIKDANVNYDGTSNGTYVFTPEQGYDYKFVAEAGQISSKALVVANFVNEEGVVLDGLPFVVTNSTGLEISKGTLNALGVNGNLTFFGSPETYIITIDGSKDNYKKSIEVVVPTVTDANTVIDAGEVVVTTNGWFESSTWKSEVLYFNGTSDEDFSLDIKGYHAINQSYNLKKKLVDGAMIKYSLKFNDGDEEFAPHAEIQGVPGTYKGAQDGRDMDMFYRTNVGGVELGVNSGGNLTAGTVLGGTTFSSIKDKWMVANDGTVEPDYTPVYDFAYYRVGNTLYLLTKYGTSEKYMLAGYIDLGANNDGTVCINTPWNIGGPYALNMTYSNFAYLDGDDAKAVYDSTVDNYLNSGAVYDEENGTYTISTANNSVAINKLTSNRFEGYFVAKANVTSIKNNDNPYAVRGIAIKDPMTGLQIGIGPRGGELKACSQFYASVEAGNGYNKRVNLPFTYAYTGSAIDLSKDNETFVIKAEIFAYDINANGILDKADKEIWKIYLGKTEEELCQIYEGDLLGAFVKATTPDTSTWDSGLSAKYPSSALVAPAAYSFSKAGDSATYVFTDIRHVEYEANKSVAFGAINAFDLNEITVDVLRSEFAGLQAQAIADVIAKDSQTEFDAIIAGLTEKFDELKGMTGVQATINVAVKNADGSDNDFVLPANTLVTLTNVTTGAVYTVNTDGTNVISMFAPTGEYEVVIGHTASTAQGNVAFTVEEGATEAVVVNTTIVYNPFGLITTSNYAAGFDSITYEEDGFKYHYVSPNGVINPWLVLGQEIGEGEMIEFNYAYGNKTTANADSWIKSAIEFNYGTDNGTSFGLGSGAYGYLSSLSAGAITYNGSVSGDLIGGYLSGNNPVAYVAYARQDNVIYYLGKKTADSDWLVMASTSLVKKHEDGKDDVLITDTDTAHVNFVIGQTGGSVVEYTLGGLKKVTFEEGFIEGALANSAGKDIYNTNNLYRAASNGEHLTGTYVWASRPSTNYGIYFDEVYSKATDVVTIEADITTRGGTADNQLGFVMADPATNKMVNFGVHNNLGAFTASVAGGNGWSYRLHDQAWTEKASDRVTGSLTNGEVRTINFKVVIDGDVVSYYVNGKYSGYADLLTLFKTKQTSGSKTWDTGSSDKYPVADAFSVGMYVFGDNATAGGAYRNVKVTKYTKEEALSLYIDDAKAVVDAYAESANANETFSDYTVVDGDYANITAVANRGTKDLKHAFDDATNADLTALKAKLLTIYKAEANEKLTALAEEKGSEYTEEFQGLINNATIDTIFAQYEYVVECLSASGEVTVSATYSNDDSKTVNANLIIYKAGEEYKTISIVDGAASIVLPAGEYTYTLDWTDFSAPASGNFTVEANVPLNLEIATDYIPWGANFSANGFTRAYDAVNGYSVTAIAGEANYVLAPVLADGTMISYKLTFNADCPITRANDNYIKNTVTTTGAHSSKTANQQLGVSSSGGNFGGTVVSRYAIGTWVADVEDATEAVSYEFAYARIGDKVYLLGKNSSDEDMYVISYTTVDGAGKDATLCLYLAGTNGKNYTYSNFVYTTTGVQDVVTAAETATANVGKYNYKAADVTRETADSYTAKWINSDYSALLPDIYEIDGEYVAETTVTFNSSGASSFVGINLADATGQLVQVGFINANLIMIPYNGNGWQARYTLKANAVTNVSNVSTARTIKLKMSVSFETKTCDKAPLHLIAHVYVADGASAEYVDLGTYDLTETLETQATNHTNWDGTDNKLKASDYVFASTSVKFGMSAWSDATFMPTFSNFTVTKVIEKETNVNVTVKYNDGTQDVNVDDANLIVKKEGVEVYTIAVSDGVAKLALEDGQYTYELGWSDFSAPATGSFTVEDGVANVDITADYIPWGNNVTHGQDSYTRSYEDGVYSITFESNTASTVYALARGLNDGETFSYTVDFHEAVAANHWMNSVIGDKTTGITLDNVGGLTIATDHASGDVYDIDFKWVRQGNQVSIFVKKTTDDEFTLVKTITLTIANTETATIKLDSWAGATRHYYSYTNFSITPNAEV